MGGVNTDNSIAGIADPDGLSRVDDHTARNADSRCDMVCRGTVQIDGTGELDARTIADARKLGSVASNPGSLLLFHGCNSLHRVTPVIGIPDRMLVVLA